MSQKNKALKQNPQGTDATDLLTSSEAFIIKNKKALIIGVVALLLIVLGLFGLRYYQNQREDKAQTLLTQGLAYVQQQNFDKALNGDGAFPGFKKIADNYSFTDASNIAKLWTGICYAKTGDVKNAIAYLEKFSPKGDHTVSPAGLATLANCYAENGQIDKAVKKFEEAAELANNDATSPEYLIQAAELLQSQNKDAEALKLYEKIKSDYPASNYNGGIMTNDSIIQDGLIDAYIQSASK
ncbi:MAG: tetratricopeptide repeat protein [Alloprevotella sp.]|nr:tetratricopeptide repeat protein [Alloprevotella sp.]